MTLLELLVVILLLGITAAVVYPSLPRRGADVEDDARAMLTTARRTAVRRGEPLRLRLDSDGVWALVALRDGETVQAGRLSSGVDGRPTNSRPVSTDGRGEARPVMIVTMDAMGSCVPTGTTATTSRFDPLACAWEATSHSPLQ